MKLLLIAVTALFVSSVSWAAAPELLPSGAGYVTALRIADRFLQAWSNRDSETGLTFVSRRIRSETNEGDIRQYIEGSSNPHHLSFEIGAGTAVDSTRFSFPVVFYEYDLGEAGAYRSAGTLDVVREPARWRVDNLPPEGR